MENIEQFPLDGLIIFSLSEYSKGNKNIADKIYEVFQLKVKEGLIKAQNYVKVGKNYEADIILSNITKAKIAQSEWIYITTQRKNKCEINLSNSSPSNSIPLNQDIYENLIKLDDKSINYQMEKLKKDYGNSKFFEVAKRSKQLIVIFPYEVEFHNFLGLSQIALNKTLGAIKTFENALKFNPKCSTLLSNMAQAQHLSGFKEHAELFYRKSLIENKNLFEANKNLGLILIDQKNFLEAEYYLNKAVKINGKCSLSIVNLSLSYRKQRKLEEALELAKKACQLSPDNFKYLNNLGLAYKYNNFLADAGECFRMAIKICPNYSEAHNNLGTVIQRNNPFEAIHHYEAAKHDETISCEVFFNLACAYRDIANTLKSFFYIKKSIKQNPNFSNGFKVLGILNVDSGNFKKAISCFKKSIEIDRYNTEVYRLLGKIYLFSKEEVLKIENLIRENIFPEEEIKHLYFALGDFFEKHKDYENSWHYLKKANDVISKRVSFSKSNAIKNHQLINKFYHGLKNSGTIFPATDKTIIFIIGMPRSGTTLIEQILSNNEFTYAGGEIDLIPKTIDQFIKKQNELSDGIDLDAFEICNNLRELYLKYFDVKTNKKILIDKMPYNFLYTGILNLVFPEAIFIDVVRNPNDNCFSIYKNYFSDNSHAYSYDLLNIRHYYSLYLKQIRLWRRALPEKIYTIKYERLINHPEQEIKHLIRFCNFTWSDSYLDFYKNKRHVFTTSANQVRQKLYTSSIGSWKNYSRFFFDK